MSMRQQELVSSGTETLSQGNKIIDDDNLNRQWVSWRSCRTLELSVQGVLLSMGQVCFGEAVTHNETQKWVGLKL